MPSAKDKKAECVKVVIRCRPLNDKEKEQGHHQAVRMQTKRGLVEVKNPKDPSLDPKQFTFDAVYDTDSKQRDLYEESFRDLVQSVLDGFNGTIFAYGQTGTGKTFTMQGVKNNPDLKGVIPNSFDHIFTHIGRSQNQQYLVRASYLEIYLEEIRDLLSKDQSKRLELKERPDTGVYVKDLSSFVTKSVGEIDHVMAVGNQNRSVGATNMNEQSSRSHAIFIVTIECSELGTDGENHIRVGKLNMVDLAGSERQAKTGAAGERLKEATKINLSLSALGNVISALVDGKSTHIPYRDSKLTRLLQDSLGGNAKTVMVANIGPAGWNFEETVTTLRYANRAKNIKNKPKINEDPKDALLREFQEEIARLKSQLGGGGGGKKKKGNKRRVRRGPDGEEYEDSGDDDESEDEETAAKRFAEEQRSKLEEEKTAIVNDKTLIAEEREKLLAEMNDKQEILRKEQQAAEHLQKKIAAMESKLLCGGKNIVDHTNEQQKVLEQQRRELAEQKKREREIQQQLEEKEEAQMGMQETYQSLQHEIEIKTKKLKKLFAKLQSVTAETEDLKEAHRKEREELEQTQNELTRELKLKMLIIDNFIPGDSRDKIHKRAFFDEEEECWKLHPLDKRSVQTVRPQSALGARRPTSEYARMAGMGGNPRYKGENILQVLWSNSACDKVLLQLELDMPNRTTRDYEGPTVAPRVQAALDMALADEADLDLDGSPAVITGKRGGKQRPAPRASASGKRNHHPASTENFPSARGLIPKH